MSLHEHALKRALQTMLDRASDPMMVAAGANLRDGGVLTFWGMPHRPAYELAITYRLRLDKVEELGIDIRGMPEAILSFDLRGSDPLDVVTIYGVEREFLVFFSDEKRDLVACISLPSSTTRRFLNGPPGFVRTV